MLKDQEIPNRASCNQAIYMETKQFATKATQTEPVVAWDSSASTPLEDDVEVFQIASESSASTPPPPPTTPPPRSLADFPPFPPDYFDTLGKAHLRWGPVTGSSLISSTPTPLSCSTGVHGASSNGWNVESA